MLVSLSNFDTNKFFHELSEEIENHLNSGIMYENLVVQVTILEVKNGEFVPAGLIGFKGEDDEGN